MNTNDFDIDFDFEKEYGAEPPLEDAAPSVEDEFDLRSILNSNYSDIVQDAEDFDFSEYLNDPQPEQQEPYDAPAYDEPSYEEASYDDPSCDGPAYDEASYDTAVADDQFSESTSYEDPQEAAPFAQEAPRHERRTESRRTQTSNGQRRKPRSKMRQFKDDQLPLIIAGVAALLIVIFIFGALGRAIGTWRTKAKDNTLASDAAQSADALEAQQAQTILDEAAALAAGYDYQAAIDKLNTFTGDTTKYTNFTLRATEYAKALSTLVAHNDPNEVANLSFHVLIADPSRAFTNAKYGGKYNMNFVTTDEFEAILEQLYANDFVLVNMDAFVDEVVNADGTVTYASKSLMLPDGKKPIMITETMVNYFNYMIDGNDDGTPDKDGAGFASRLVVDESGAIKAEMVNADGTTVVGNYDLVPILEDFIAAHPDFSYRGSRAILAVTGSEGIFGYRTNPEVATTKSQAYYDEQVAGATQVVNALKDAGYTIASYTYGNTRYSDASATTIQEETDKFTKEVLPITGAIDTIVFAQSSDIASAGSYSGNKYNVLSKAGYRYFIGNGNRATTDIYAEYVRQNRLMVTGSNMYYSSTTFSTYFDSKSVLNTQRGNIPQA